MTGTISVAPNDVGNRDFKRCADLAAVLGISTSPRDGMLYAPDWALALTRCTPDRATDEQARLMGRPSPPRPSRVLLPSLAYPTFGNLTELFLALQQFIAAGVVVHVPQLGATPVNAMTPLLDALASLEKEGRAQIRRAEERLAAVEAEWKMWAHRQRADMAEQILHRRDMLDSFLSGIQVTAGPTLADRARQAGLTADMLAQATGLSKHSVGRCLRGETDANREAITAAIEAAERGDGGCLTRSEPQPQLEQAA